MANDEVRMDNPAQYAILYGVCTTCPDYPGFVIQRFHSAPAVQTSSFVNKKYYYDVSI
jgi:hypothetical protein